MPKNPENNQRTSLDDRRNNIREKIASEVYRLQSEKKQQPKENTIKPEKPEFKGYKAILEQEREFEKSISALPQEEIKKKRLERIEQVKKWYKKAQISENYLIERARQLYHNLPGDIPQFFKRPRIDQATFNRTLGKGLSRAEKKENFNEYDNLAIEEKNQFEDDRSAGKDLNPDKVLDEARYKEFATTREKEVFDANEKILKEAFQKFKEEHPEEYKKEMERREKEEKARKKEELNRQTEEYEKQLNSYKDKMQAFGVQVENLIHYFEGQKQYELDELKLGENSSEITEKYDDIIQRIEDHRDDLWISDYKAFTEDEINVIESFVTARDRERPTIKKTEKDENIAKAPTDKKVVNLNKRIETGLLETSNVSLNYFRTHLQYGLKYAVEHHGRMDRSILMPALDELSELTVISHDISAEYKKQSEALPREYEAHTKAKPWIFAKLFNTKRWQKWETREKEFATTKNNLSAVAQKIMDQRQLIGEYISGLKTAGVSQEMINKCSVYEKAVANTQITEKEIKDEVIRCKKQFDDKINSLKEKGDTKEIARIFAERMGCINGSNNIRSIRESLGIFSKEEIDELYPEKQIEKNAPLRADRRTEAIDNGSMGFREAFYSDFNVDYDKSADLTDIYDKDQSVKENSNLNIKDSKKDDKSSENGDFYDKREVKSLDDEIFGDEINLANELGVLNIVKEIDNNGDLQNSLLENTTENAQLSKSVSENKLEKGSIEKE